MNDVSPLIELRSVARLFAHERGVVDIDLTIARGDSLAILGPSGSGKSTLLSLLGLIDPPTSGSICFQGRDVSAMSPAEGAHLRNREIGFVFQSFNLLGEMTVVENVELPLTYRTMTRAERRDRAIEALTLVHLADRSMDYPGQLSGGEQQRVAIARAIVGEPSLILADEPTGNLDSHGGQIVQKLLSELNDAGTTICVATHERSTAQFARRAIHLLDGRIVREE